MTLLAPKHISIVAFVLITGVSRLPLWGQAESPANEATSHRTTRIPFETLVHRADEALKASRFEEAAKLYREAVEQRPAWSQGWSRLGNSFFRVQRYPDALNAYREVTILTPKDGPAWAYLGLCEYELKDYRRAFDDMSKGEKLGLGEDRDLTAQVKYHLAVLWNSATQFDMALREMLWFTRQNLGGPEILEAIGLSVLRAPVLPEKVPEEKKEMLILAGGASFAANVQKMDEAAKLYQQLVAKYPTEANVHFAYAKFLSHMDLDGSLREYEKEIELNPSHTVARVEASLLYLKEGEFEKALAQAQEAAKLQPQNAAAHNLAGRALTEMDRAVEAVPELEQAVHLAPENATFHLNLARAYQKTGEAALAAKEIATFDELEKRRAVAQPTSPTPSIPTAK